MRCPLNYTPLNGESCASAMKMRRCRRGRQSRLLALGVQSVFYSFIVRCGATAFQSPTAFQSQRAGV